MEQARHFHNVVGTLEAGNLIPWLDVEDEHSSIGGPAVAWPVISAQLAVCVDECERLFGVKPGIYTGRWFWDRLPSAGRFADCRLWIAHWFKDQQPGGKFALPAGWSDYAIHQYTSAGRVAGITGNVDLDWTPDIARVTVLEAGNRTDRIVAALNTARAGIDQAQRLLNEV